MGNSSSVLHTPELVRLEALEKISCKSNEDDDCQSIESGSTAPVSNQVSSPAGKDIRNMLFTLNPPLIQMCEKIVDDSTERRAFITFVESDMWEDHMNIELYKAIAESSKNFFEQHVSASHQDMPKSAQVIYQQEIDVESILNTDRVSVEECFSVKDLRTLTLCFFLSAYLRYCTCHDYPHCTNHTHNYAKTEASSSSTNSVPSHNLDVLFGLPDNSFFLDPVELIQQIKLSTSMREFDRILAAGSWLSEIYVLIDKLSMPLSISSHESNEHTNDSQQENSIVYTNVEFASNFTRDSFFAEYVPLDRYDERDLQGLRERWSQLMATKTRLLRKDTGESYFLSTLPVRNCHHASDYIIALHHPITTSSLTQLALLRLTDFVLLVLGSLTI